MLKQIVSQALESHDFKIVHSDIATGYYIRDLGDSIRFAIIHELSETITPDDLNVQILQSAPPEFTKNPAFKKNCDLICTLRFEHLSEFKNLEQQIFALEEDAYHFKKYILYYSNSEEQMLEDVSYLDLFEAISKKDKFDEYKASPLTSSKYSIAARIFIKLPFLELPYNEQDLTPLGQQAEEAVKEFNYDMEYGRIQKISADDTDIENLIKELIQHELENIQD